MSLIQVKCNNCGSNMQIDDTREKTFCSSCGAQYLYERPVSVHIENINIGNIPPQNHSSKFSFDMQEYAIPFSKQEEQVRHDWLNLIMSYDDAPLDVASKTKIISITKQYYPVAFFDVTCTAEWNALSYWEHDESYQEVEKHRTLSGEVEHRVVTKYRTIIDAVQQTNGNVIPTTHTVKVCMGPDPESSFSSELLSWIDIDSECTEINDDYLKEFSVYPKSRNRDEAVKLAEDYAHQEMNELAKTEVPGDRYENLRVTSYVENTKMTIRYVAVYNVKYEYAGTTYNYCSPGENNDKFWTNGHPTDISIQTRVNELKTKADSIKMWPWILALILAPIPFIMLAVGFASGSSSEFGRVFSWASMAAIYAFFIFMLVFSIIRKSAANEALSTYKSKNDSLKKQVRELFKDDSLSDDIKSASVEKLIQENNIEIENAASTKKLNNLSGGRIGLIIGIVFSALIIVGIGSSFIIAAKTKANEKAKAIAESKAQEESELEAEELSKKQGKEAKLIVESFLTAAKTNNVDTMNSCISTNCQDKFGILDLIVPERFIKVLLKFDNYTPNQLSDDSLKQLNTAACYFSQSFISSYDLDDVEDNGDGTYTVTVSAKLIDLDSYDDIHNTKLKEYYSYVETNHSDELNAIYYSSSSDYEAKLRAYEYLVPYMSKAITEGVNDAKRYDIKLEFTVQEVEGSYKITTIDYHK